MKKVLSILLALVLITASLSTGTAAFAKTKSVTVTYSVYDGEFKMEPTKLEVFADLSDKYAEAVGFNDSSNEPTILDATIAAHLKMFGDFTKEAPLVISTEYGYAMLVSAFGKAAYASSYRVNGAFSGGITDKVATGDYVEFMFFQDSSYYSDTYTFFDSRSKSALTKQSVTLYLSKEVYDESYNPVIAPAVNADITVNGKAFGKTDENGKITLSFDEKGTYKISAKNSIDDAPIFAPWCKIEVSTTKLFDYVEKETKSAAEYALNGVKALNVNSAIDYLTYLKSGYDMSNFNTAFLASVKANLDENSGKLMATDYMGNKQESIGLYGAVIQILDILGSDASDFAGYDIVNAFENIDLSASYHPYYYRVAIEAADEEFAKKLCDKLISEHYVMGHGLDNWGYSCDNTAHFLTAISKYKEDYPEYVSDAKKVIKSYTKNNGAFADSIYVTEVNPDSTALAMMAFASVGDLNTAFTYYKNLVEGFEGKTGVFKYNGEDNLYATKDALLALEYFKNAVEAQGFEHPEEVLKTTTVKATTKKNGSITTACVVCGKVSKKTTIYYPKTIKLSSTSFVYSAKAIKPRVIIKDSKGNVISSDNYTVKYSDNKKVGSAKVKIKFKGNYSGTVEKSFKINPKNTSISKVTAKSKGFTVKWKKQTAQTTGYQLQYATNKDFTKNKKTVTISNNKTTSKAVKKLKAEKKYYVRIRTYKTVNGKKYYSGWSKTQTVKTNK